MGTHVCFDTDTYAECGTRRARQTSFGAFRRSSPVFIVRVAGQMQLHSTELASFACCPLFAAPIRRHCAADALGVTREQTVVGWAVGGFG